MAATDATAHAVPFLKVEGLKNDFVVVDGAAGGEPLRALATRVAWCDRRTGIGADGVLTLLPPSTPGALATMHVTNSDGSVPEMCGNGLRCVGRVLVERGDAPAFAPFVVDTGAGPRTVTVRDDEVEVDMGIARFVDEAAGVPALDGEILVDGAPVRATAVSMGNPHLVLELDGEDARVRRLGPVLEHDPRFPKGVNVGFARRVGDGLALVVWERGAGLTEACGTGACAAAVAFVHRGELPRGRPVAVTLPGGRLAITVGDDGHVHMRGPARVVFRGVVP